MMTVAQQTTSKIQRLLASLTSLDAFLSETMRSANEALEVRGSTVFLIDREQAQQCLHMACLDGEVMQRLPILDGFQYRICCRYHGSLDPLLRGLPTFAKALADRPLLDEKTINWLRARGVRGLLRVPVIVQDATAAILIFHKDDEQPFAPDKLDLAIVLGELVAVAIHVSRLAEEARESAVARERETAALKRAAEMMRANDELRSAIDLLGQSTDRRGIDQFLGRTFLSIHTLLHLPSGTFWNLNEAHQELNLRFVVEDGMLIDPAVSAYPVQTAEMKAPASNRDAFYQRKPSVWSVVGWPETPERDYWQARNIGSFLSLPLVVQNRALGCICLHIPEGRTLEPFEKEFAQSLANHAALAMQLELHAEQAKQIAVLQERERAAEDRAASLAKANAAMKQALDGVANASDLEESRQFVLAALIQHLDAVEGSLWRYRESDSVLLLDLEFADGVFHSSNSVRFRHGASHGWVGKHGPSLHENPELLAGDARLIDVAETSLLRESAKKDLLAKGAQTLVTLPLFAANRHLGCLALLLRPRRALTDAERELASALANQAALMLETSRLATQSRIAAQQRSIAEERNRIGSEIHDGLQQTLYAIALQMGTATRMLDRGDRDAAMRSMVAAAELAERGGTEARRSVQALRPRELEEQTSLAGALEELCAKCSDQTLNCRFELSGGLQQLTHAIENTIFRVSQEALSNALKHADASKLLLSLEYLETEVILTIQDNGRGMEIPTSRSDGQGYGFRTMRERAEIVGGSLSIKSSTGTGTKVQLRIPLS